MYYADLQRKVTSISSNRAFEAIVISIIVISAISIGAKTYPLNETLFSLLTTLDYCISLFFLLELLLRITSAGSLKRFAQSGWNVFDALIIFISVIPIEETNIATIARLVRLFRILRMISIIPELRILINSLLRVFPKLGYVALLMFIIFYIYAAIGCSFFKNINPELWGDISISMLTLFRVMTFEDWTDVMYETMSVYQISWVYYLTFIFFTAFAFLNMIIGVIVSGLEEEIKKSKKVDDEVDLVCLQNQLKMINEKLDRIS